ADLQRLLLNDFALLETTEDLPGWLPTASTADLESLRRTRAEVRIVIPESAPEMVTIDFEPRIMIKAVELSRHSLIPKGSSNLARFQPDAAAHWDGAPVVDAAGAAVGMVVLETPTPDGNDLSRLLSVQRLRPLSAAHP
ncbi:MAG: hypothetical protein ACRDD1_06065, partial [Planctomycetia bacterium]